MKAVFLSVLALVALPFQGFVAAAPAPKPFEIIRGCRLKDAKWNDGDSFHAILPLGNPFHPTENCDLVVRLYFVDTPEAEKKYADRIQEQAAYFGITEAQAVELAARASEFVASRLEKPFTVYTNGRPAMGLSAGGRIYAFIFTWDNADLNAALVLNGLARIHGTATKIPNGWTTKQYMDRLVELEGQAKAAGRGGWGMAGATAAAPAKPVPASPKPPAATVPASTPATPASGGYAASSKSDVFHKAGCKSVARVSAANLVKYATREEAIAAGKSPCAVCKP